MRWYQALVAAAATVDSAGCATATTVAAISIDIVTGNSESDAVAGNSGNATVDNHLIAYCAETTTAAVAHFTENTSAAATATDCASNTAANTGFYKLAMDFY